MPDDLKDFRYDRHNGYAKIQGVLYKGDAQTKYTIPNRPIYSRYRSVRPEELAVVNQLPNEAEASQFMLKIMDFDPKSRTVHPTVPSPDEVQEYVIPP